MSLLEMIISKTNSSVIVYKKTTLFPKQMEEQIHALEKKAGRLKSTLEGKPILLVMTIEIPRKPA